MILRILPDATGWRTRPFPGQENLEQAHISGKDHECKFVVSLSLT